MLEKDLTRLTIGKLASLLQEKKVSPVEITRALLERIYRLNKKVNAYITILEEQALDDAQRAEKDILTGNYKGPLHGIPIAVKDNIETKGIKTTCASKLREDHVSTYNATVIQRLQGAGAILLGKLNMQEFAIGATSANSHYGPVRNPWDLERIPGGSSGGSAAAISASLAIGTLGTDTRGSVRIPASLCGIVGLKQTYGLVSNFGVTPVSWSLDHVSPMTRTVEDAAIMLQAIVGHDPNDPTTCRVSLPDYRAAIHQDIRGIKLGVPTNFFFTNIDEEVEKAAREAIRVFKGLGASVEEVTIPNIEFVPIAGSFVSPVEAYVYHEPLLQTRAQEYQSNVRERLLSGAVILAADYVKSQQYRNLLRKEVQKILQRVDALITPSTAITAPKIGEGMITIRGQKQEVLRLLSTFTATWNLTGHPAISIPCGFASNNLPIGLQIAGRLFDEPTIIRIAHNYETNTTWHERRPTV